MDTNVKDGYECSEFDIGWVWLFISSGYKCFWLIQMLLIWYKLGLIVYLIWILGYECHDRLATNVEKVGYECY